MRLVKCTMQCCLMFLILCSTLMAQNIVLSQGEMRIPRGQSRIFEFGMSSQENTTMLLDILARLDSGGYGGSMYFMKIVLNGDVVNAAKSRTAMRIINRKLISPVAPNMPYRWFDNEAWRVLYAPNFEGALKFPFYEGNPYQTVLDVTDLLKGGAKNRLEIFNVCNYNSPVGSKAKYDLVIKNMILRGKPGVSSMKVASSVDQDIINRGTPGAGPARYKGALMPGGGFRLKVGDRDFNFSSRISFPNAGMNELTPTRTPATGGQSQFHVATELTAEGGQVIAAGPDYRITRTVRFTTSKVEVTDKITNLHTGQKLGLILENCIKVDNGEAKVRLAGIPDNSINSYYSPGNPSVYVALQNIGLGLLCEDDVYRNQATLFFDKDRSVAGLRTDKLCLPAGGSYTLRWSVYPVASGDYYDFINLVRHDWGANYTVQGAWTFFDPDAIIAASIKEIREQFTRLGIKHACSWGGWVDRRHDPRRIGFGTGVLDEYWADFRNRLRLAAEKIHEAVPHCKVYAYYNTQRDTSEGGRQRFMDSWLSDERGQQIWTEWDGEYSKTYSFVATQENSFGKAMLAAVDRYFKELKVDGLYWDEMENVGYGVPLVSYNVADGHSCELGPKTYTIRREIGINTIMGEAHRVEVMKRVRELGGYVMGNGPIATKKSLALNPQRMIEIQHNIYWNYEGDLGSPLGLLDSRNDFGSFIRSLKMAKLPVGTRYDYSYDIGTHIFPFTPIELHPGYLLGRERIIATHSGNYGWPGDKCLVQVRHFDSRGKLTQKDFKTIVAGEARTDTVIGNDEAIVLVRLPVTVTELGGLVAIHGVQYDATGLKFAAEATNGFSVAIHNGEMRVSSGQEFNVKVGGASQAERTDERGILSVNFGPMPGPFTVEICPL